MSESHPLVLVAAADAGLRRMLADHLDQTLDALLEEAASGEEVLARCAEARLVILDDSLAGTETARLAAALRAGGLSGGLLLLGSVTGCGGEAVIPKPLRLPALTSRAAALLAAASAPRIGSWRLDAPRRVLEGAGAAIRLTAKEAALLELLSRPGAGLVQREVLLAEIWGYGEGIDTHTLETHVYRLRRKLGDGEGRLLVSAEGGYRLATVLTD